MKIKIDLKKYDYYMFEPRICLSGALLNKLFGDFFNNGLLEADKNKFEEDYGNILVSEATKNAREIAVSMPPFEGGAWNQENMDQLALDYANALCNMHERFLLNEGKRRLKNYKKKAGNK